MAEDVVAVNVIARDGASATLSRISKETKLLGGGAAAAAGPMGRLGAATGGMVTPLTLGIGAAAGLSVALAGMLENAKADQASQRLLQASLEANIPSYEGNTDAIEKVIQSRLRLGFVDEDQREGLRLLVAQTKDVNKALEIQRTAMDLARLKGIDLTTASVLLGKVYGGNIGILTRYGIQLKAGTTAQEAFAEVQRRAAGQAEAYSSSLEGQTEALGIALDEAGEQIGYALIGPLTALVEELNTGVLPAVQDFIGLLGSIGDASDQAEQAIDDVADSARDMGFELDPKQWAFALHDFFLGWSDGAKKASTDTGSFTAAVENMGGTIVAVADESVAHAAQKFGGLPKLAGDEIHDAQFHFQDAVDDLRQYMEDYLTPKQETMRLKAFLASDAVADGLASGEAVIRRKTKILVNAAQAELEKLNGWAPGSYAAQQYIAGIAEGIRAGVPVIGSAMLYMKMNTWGESPPRQGPMMPSRIDSAAKWAANQYTSSLAAGLREGFDTPGFATGGATVGAPGRRGGAVGGVTININSTFPPKPSDAEALARALIPALDREQRRQRASR